MMHGVDHTAKYDYRHAHLRAALRARDAAEVCVVVAIVCLLPPIPKDIVHSFLWEKFITLWNYHGIEDLTPAHLGLFQGTPVRRLSAFSAIVSPI